MPARTRRVTFPATGDGLLLAGVLHLPGGSEPCPAAAVCHPHPLMGGTMDNTITVALCRTLAARGWATLRFDFRGAGRSEGALDAGRGEMDDVAGAFDFLCAQADVDPDRLAVMGYSFGAGVALHIPLDTDHFFGGRESEVVEIIADWLQDQAADCGPP